MFNKFTTIRDLQAVDKNENVVFEIEEQVTNWSLIKKVAVGAVIGAVAAYEINKKLFGK